MFCNKPIAFLYNLIKKLTLRLAKVAAHCATTPLGSRRAVLSQEMRHGWYKTQGTKATTLLHRNYFLQ